MSKRLSHRRTKAGRDTGLARAAGVAVVAGLTLWAGAPHAAAQTVYVWNGTTDGSWWTASRWTPAVVPNALNAFARIDNDGSYTVTIDRSTTMNGFALGRFGQPGRTGQTLEFRAGPRGLGDSATLSVGYCTILAPCTFRIGTDDRLDTDPESLRIVASLANNRLDNQGTIYVTGQGLRDIRVPVLNGAGGLLDVDTDASFADVQSAGAITVSGSSTVSAGYMTLTGGTLDVAAGSTLSMTGEGEFRLAGGAVIGAGSFQIAGPLNVTGGGTLSNVQAMSVTGPVTHSGGTVSGTGTIQVGGPAPTVNFTGTTGGGGTFVAAADDLRVTGTTKPGSTVVRTPTSSSVRTLTLDNGAVNRGTLNVQAGRTGIGAAASRTYLRTASTTDPIYNEGTINFSVAGAGPGQILSANAMPAPLVNRAAGTVNVFATSRFDGGVSNSGGFNLGLSGSASVRTGTGEGSGGFTQASGVLTVPPTGSLDADRFTYVGGTVNGLVNLRPVFEDRFGTPPVGTPGSGGPVLTDVDYTTTLDFRPGAGGGQFLADESNLEILGSPSPGSVVTLRNAEPVTMRLPAGATNRATLFLQSTNDIGGTVPGVKLQLGTASGNQSVLNAGTINFERNGQSNAPTVVTGQLDNQSGGAVNVRGAVNPSTTVINRGAFNVAPGGHFVQPTVGQIFVQTGGTLTVDPNGRFEMPNLGTFEYQGGQVVGAVDLPTQATTSFPSIRIGANAGGGTFRLSPVAVITGNPTPGMRLEFASNGTAAFFDAGAINRGTIVAPLSAQSSFSAGGGTASFFNEGRIEFAPTTSASVDSHRVRAALDNRAGGIIVVSGNTELQTAAINRGTWTVTNGARLEAAAPFVQAGGTLNGALAVTGATGGFSLQGGQANLSQMELAGGSTTIDSGQTIVAGSLIVSAGANLVRGGATTAGVMQVGVGGYQSSATVPVIEGSAVTLAGDLRLEASGGQPGRLALGGNVRHQSGKTAGIRSTTPAAGQKPGVVDLLGGVRTFDIADGIDLGTMPAGRLVVDAVVTNGGIRKTGPSTLSLLRANDFTRGLRIEGGTVDILADNTMSGGVVVTGGDGLIGGLHVDRNAAFGTANNPVTIAGGVLALDSLAVSRTLTFGLLNGGGGAGTIEVSSGGSSSLLAPATGTTGLVKSGAGTLTLAAVNTYAGATEVREGTLAMAPGSAPGGGVRSMISVAPGAILALRGSSQTIGSLVGDLRTASHNGGTVDLDGGVLTVAGTQSQTEFNGIVQGAGTFVRAGDGGTTILSGVVAHSVGGVRVDGGTLRLANLANTFAGPVRVNGGTLTTAGNGGLGETTNAVMLNSGALQFEASQIGTTSARAITVSADSSLAVSGGGTVSFTGAMTGSAPLALRAFRLGEQDLPGGTFSLRSPSPTFTGDLNVGVDGGTFELAGAAGSLTGAANFAIAKGGTLRLDETAGEADRIADTAMVTLTGGTLAYSAQSAAEKLGRLIAAEGSSVLRLEGGAGTLALDSITASRGNNIDIIPVGGVLGIDYHVFVAGAFPSSSVSVQGQLAEYRPAYGIVPVTFVEPGGGGVGVGSAVPEPSTGALLATISAALSALRPASGRRRWCSR